MNISSITHMIGKSFCFVALMLQGICLQSQTYAPVADAYIRNGNYASTNYGKSSTLEVKTSSVTGNTRYALLMFDLSQAGTLNINTATLRIYVTSASSFTIGAYKIAGAWSEKSINWNKAPVAGVLISSVAMSTGGKYYDWDLGSYVKEMFAAGTRKFSILLKDVGSAGLDVVANSKESSSNKPQLVITTVTASVPLSPTVLTASAISSSQINLSWIDNASDETGYSVEAKSGTGAFTNVGTLLSNATVFSHTGLSSSTLYTYRVRASNAAGNSAYSNEASATTQAPPPPPSSAYYIDGINGNDLNNGTSSTSAWKNLSKLYNLTVLPGTSIFLKAGSVWTGQQLKFIGSGTSAAPIVVDKYDAGVKPVLHGNGLVGQGVVYLYNQSYIEVNNLEVTNDPAGPANSHFFNVNGADRRGVMVAIDNYGVASHIYFSNMDIHHIKGQLGSGSTSVNGAIPKRTGGIFFTVLGNLETSSSLSRFNDVKIEGCNIYYCENIGIALDNEWDVFYPGGTEYNDWYKRRYTNIQIRNNVIHHIGKNAMIIRCTDETGLIERNVCYETAMGTTGNTMFTARAKGTVFQYNEGYFNRATTQSVNPGNIDGSMYDADFGSVSIVFQYSYSHDNSEGLYWGCNTRGGANNTSGVPDPGDTAVTVRYNISQNDKGDLIFFNYPSAGNKVYNNVFYIGATLSPNIIHENSSQHTYEFYNNIIYNLSPTADYSFKDVNQTRFISNNIFYGYHPTGSLTGEPADPFKITADPMFISPGSATIGLGTTNGYQLNSNSPAINNGKVVVNNGYLDYWGNELYTGVPDIGAYERPLLQAANSNPAGLVREAGGSMRIFPNPAGKSFQIVLGGTTDLKDAEVLIIAPDGKLMSKAIRKVEHKTIRVDISELNLHGIYWVKVISGLHVFSKMVAVE